MEEDYKNIKFDFEAVFEPEDYLYFYRDSLTVERTKRELDFLVEKLKLNKPMKILDLACGHGRHSNPLAELGHCVTGADITSGFLDIARNEAEKKGLSVDYIKKDMREITFENRFDRVLLLFTSFGYFEDEDNLSVLRNVERALKSGGLFCFDTFNRDEFHKNFLPFHVVEKGDDQLIDRITFDSSSNRLYNRRIVIRDGKRKEKPFFIRLYNPTEIKKLLRKAGLELFNIYSHWDGSPFETDSMRMIIIARKIFRQ